MFESRNTATWPITVNAGVFYRQNPDQSPITTRTHVVMRPGKHHLAEIIRLHDHDSPVRELLRAKNIAPVSRAYFHLLVMTIIAASLRDPNAGVSIGLCRSKATDYTGWARTLKPGQRELVPDTLV